MKFKRDQLSLYLVMGTANCLKSPEIVLEEAIRGGVTIFQFREKGKDCLQGEARYELAKNLQVICKRNMIPFIINDDVELAMRLDADGVHIGQEDGNIAEIRRVIGHKILGISTHHLEEARNAVKLGADYIGVGPMFMTKTKEDIQEVRGPIVIEEIRKFGIKLPLVGIGGITEQNLGEVMNAGADGVAVISSITRHEYPIEIAKTLSNQIMTHL
jgi:thiamine-phosphate pyrophosphorylase